MKWLPRHRQIENLLSDRIGTVWKVGDRIPPETQLCQELGVSRVTVHKALSGLVRCGIVRRWRGRGTFVACLPTKSDFGKLTGSLDDIKAQGHQVRAKILERKATLLPSELTRLFGLSEGEDPVGLFVRRVVMVNDQPLAIIMGHLPYKIAGEFRERDLETKTVSTLLAEAGWAPRIVDQIVGVTAADPETAEHLGVNPGTPLLRIERVFYARGRAVHRAVSLYRGDRYQYVQRLRQTRGAVVRAASSESKVRQ